MNHNVTRQHLQGISRGPVFALFDPHRETTVSADASSYGQDDGQQRPVVYASRSMSPTEQRYAQNEKGVLTITWASRSLDELPLRLQRFRMRMLRYCFSISHVPGKNLIVADALSRAPEAPNTAWRGRWKHTSMR